jgi:alpha-mannosidase
MPFRELTILLPCHSLDDFPLYHVGADAHGLLAAWSGLWHPFVLHTFNALPTWERVDDPPSQVDDKIFVLPTCTDCTISEEFRQDIHLSSGELVEDFSTREELTARLLELIKNQTTEATNEQSETIFNSSRATHPISQEVIADFYALGMAYLWTELLTRRMRYMSMLDQAAFQKNALAAASAIVNGNETEYSEHLQRAFDTLFQARSHFYPVDNYLLDVTLVVPSVAGEPLRKSLTDQCPTTLLMNGKTLDHIAAHEQQTLEAIRAAIAEGYVSILASDYSEGDLPLMTQEAILTELQKTARTFEQHLGAAPQFYARRKHGPTAALPAILHDLGYRGAWHTALDDGQVPQHAKNKIHWQGLGPYSIEAVTRPPQDANEPGPLLNLPEQVGESMDHDMTAFVVFAHWPGRVTPFYADLRRAAPFAATLGKFVTWQQFFDETTTAEEYSKFECDDYRLPYLKQAVARNSESPLGQVAKDYQTATRDESTPILNTLNAILESATGRSSAEEPVPASNGELILLNPTNSRWRRSFRLPEDWLDVADRTTENSLQQNVAPKFLSVDVPALGYVRITPAIMQQSNDVKPAKPAPLIASELKLKNEFCEVTISESSGAITAIRPIVRPANRLSQQLVMRLPGPSQYTSMKADSIEITHNSPALGQITSRGYLIDETDVKCAKFEQITRLLQGSRVVEIEISIEPLESPVADPWSSYFALRWAWPDASMNVCRSVHETIQTTRLKRIDAPQFIELRDEKQATTILANGYPYHLRTDQRMLDTLLIVKGDAPISHHRVGIGIDLANPAISAKQFELEHSSATVLNATDAQSALPPSAWFLHIDARNALVTFVEPIRDQGETNQIVGLRMRIMETKGLDSRGKLSAYRPFASANRVQFNGELFSILHIHDGAVELDLAPNDWFEIAAYW